MEKHVDFVLLAGTCECERRREANALRFGKNNRRLFSAALLISKLFLPRSLPFGNT
jgi:hypothetical protein